jgi:hypothetical protein
LWNVLDHHNALRFLAGTFQNDIVSFGLFDGKELNSFIFGFNPNGKLPFADLALELFEVVVKRTANNFFLDLDANPLKKAIQVNSAT